MNYLDENEVRDEIIKLQKTNKLKELLSKENLTDSENNEIFSLKEEGIDPNYKKTRFGEMCLLLIRRILTLPKFSGYTYKDDFTSNAIEKLMMYSIKNYDTSKKSKITGEPVKAFAYLTQIIMNAIIQVINERKAENELMKNYYNENTQEKQNYIIYSENENIVQYDYVVNCFDKINDVMYLLTGSNNREEYPDGKIGYCLVNGKLTLFNTIYDVIKDFKKGSRVMFVYPSNYKFSMDEFNKISDIGFSVVNITKYEYKYVPSFPKRQKKIVENELLLWGE